MKISIALDLGDGPYTVTTNLYAVVAWERKYKRRASELANGVGVEDLAYMAYEASKAAKIVVPALFDDFVKQLVSLDVVGQEATNPTTGEPTDED
jgi:hypothetical protein